MFVKIFTQKDPQALEKEINDWLGSSNNFRYTIKDIKYQVTLNISVLLYSALIIAE